MTRLPIKPPFVTVEEYLRIEADGVDRHEYLNGRVVAMAGSTPEHSLIIMNVGGELRQRLKGKPCRVYDSNLRIRVPGTTLYTYPDLSVICGETRFDPRDPHRTTVTNPRLLVEVLSPSTEGLDRGEKFRRYLTIDSLEEYVLVAPQAPFVQTFFRQPDGTWVMTPATELKAVARLRSLGIDLPLAEVYAGVEFPPEPDDTPSAS